MFTIIIRVIIIYTVVLFLYRIMGKRQLGQMQPFELVLTLIIADLATIPMAEVNVPVLHGVVPLLTLFIVHSVLTFLSKQSVFLSEFISGKPVIIIDPNGINYNALRALNITMDDVLEGMRGCGYFKLEQVEYAIMETTGKMSIMPKSGFAPLTAEDMKIKVEESTLPVNIISEGKILKENLKIANLSEESVKQIMEKLNVKKVKEILILTIDKNGEIFMQKIKGGYFTLKLDLKKVQ